MATRTKSNVIAVQVFSDEKLMRWLKENDEHLFLQKCTLKRSRELYESHARTKVKPKVYRDYVYKFCSMFKQMNLKKEPTIPVGLTEQQWQKVRVWLEKHEDLVKKASCVDIVTQYMLNAKITVNTGLLNGSSTLQRIRK